MMIRQTTNRNEITTRRGRSSRLSRRRPSRSRDGDGDRVSALSGSLSFWPVVIVIVEVVAVVEEDFLPLLLLFLFVGLLLVLVFLVVGGGDDDDDDAASTVIVIAFAVVVVVVVVFGRCSTSTVTGKILLLKYP